MNTRRRTRACLGAVAMALAIGCSARPLTPEQARTKGDAMLKQMSQTVAGTKAFSYRTEQAIDKIRGNNERVTEQFTRTTTVRRPDRMAFTDKGQDHDALAWYDGKYVTAV